MELMTFLCREDGKTLPGVAYHPATQGDDYYSKALEHDAAMAHALFSAMEEWWSDVDANDLSPAHSAVSWIGARAAELMREWGYDDKVTP